MKIDIKSSELKIKALQKFQTFVLLTGFFLFLSIWGQAQPQQKDFRTMNAEQILDHLMLAKNVVFSNKDSSLVMLNQVEPLIEKQNDEAKAVFYNTLGLYHWFNRDYDAAIKSFETAFHVCGSAKNLSTHKAEAANNAGTLYSRMGSHDTAIALLNEAIAIDILSNNEAGLGKSYYDLGLAYERKDQFELALRYMLRSKDLNEKNEVSPQRILSNYNVLANLYNRIKDSTSSMVFFRKALEIAAENNDSSYLCMLNSNISVMYSNQNQAEKSLVFALKSKTFVNEKNSFEYLPIVLTNIASAYYVLNRPDSSIYYYRQLSKYLDDLRLMDRGEVLIQMSSAYLKENMVDSAMYFNQKGLEIVRSLSSYSLIAEGLLTLSAIDSARNDFKSAYINYKRGQTINDSILDNEHKSRIVEMKIIYEVDKKESENQLLVTQNQLKERMIKGQRLALFGFIFLVLLLLVSIYLLNRTRKKIAAQKEVIATNNLRLQELNQTKDKFISIIAHDLRSPFNSLLGLLQELSENYRSYTDEEKIHIIENLYVSSTNTYGLLVNLLDWTLAQRSGFENKPTDTNLYLAVESVFRFLSGRAQQKKHLLVNQVEHELTVFVDQNILTNIIINLVNNAIKFTKDEGRIEVSALVQLDGRVRIFVKDTGIGIPADKIQQLFDLGSDFKRKGTSDEMGTGLGLVLAKEFIKMSHGELSVESEEGKGSTFSFTLPTKAS